jgi:hypothetical protein
MNKAACKYLIAKELSDVAERRTQAGLRLGRGQRRLEQISGEARRVCIRGDHVCYGGVERFRDSDVTLRLTNSVTAAETLEEIENGRCRGNHKRACIRIAEYIMNSACPRLRERFLKGKRVQRRFAESQAAVKKSQRLSKTTQCHNRIDELDQIIAASERAELRQRDAKSPLIRLAATVSSQVSRYRTQNPNWRNDFERRLDVYRAGFPGDHYWHVEMKQQIESMMRQLEQRQKPFDWFAAMHIVSFGDMYHRQGKYRQARAIYGRAIRIARQATMADKLRRAVIYLLRVKSKACLHRARAIVTIAYSGPWLPDAS